MPMNSKTILLSALILINACSIFTSKETDPILDQENSQKQDNVAKKGGSAAVDAQTRAQNYRDEHPMFDFGGNGKKNNTNFVFGTSNVLWRATLKTLDFIPLTSADYAGGIIIFDWYSDISNPKEQIKLTVKFLSNDVRSDALQVTAFKKTCINDKCATTKTNDNFTDEIKDSILTAARNLKLQDAKSQKN
jgi:hypothetical protein